ncbi:MAG TPA: hypothetical protein VLB11_08585 [Methyloceanibacter sp.]|nr:hypothetical protein [Methyloceanibacter sp.]
MTTDVGDTLSLFAVGIALFALFIASYSRRGTWIALGSMAMSMALLFGCLLLATTRDRSQLRARLAWAASKLPLALDRQTVDQLAASLEPIQTPAPRHAERAPVQAAAAPAGWFDTKPDPKENSPTPIAWDLDEPGIQSPVTSPWGFSIGGTNVSDQALEQVHAVLKPDSTKREFELALDVEGNLLEDEPVIPAGARFSLVSDSPDEDGSSLGGAILSFRYVQAGQRKTSILYLTPSMLARFASRG